MADISTAVSMARVPILGENGRISDDYIPAAIGENVTKAESAATRAETAAAGAEGSASAASTSATQASGSASAASASASQAQQSATAAGGAATSAQSAQTAAEAAKTAAEAAQSAAAGSAQDAQQSATAAQQSASSVADKFISSAQATTLEPGSQATASVENQVLTIGVPKGEKGDKGDQGEKGDTGTGVPEGGEPGQLLSKTESGTAWVDPPSGNVLKGTLGPAPVLSADDAYATKPRRLTVYGKTVQNLWVNPSGTNKGVTVTSNADGSITVNGTTTGNASFNSGKKYILKPSTTYTLSIDKAISQGYFDVREVDSSGSFLGTGHVSSVEGTTFTTDANMAYVYMRFLGIEGEGTEYSGTYRVMLNEGPTAQPWCPPGLNSIDELSVVTAGKNLWVNPSGTSSGVTLTDNDDGSVTVSGTAISGVTIGGLGNNRYILKPSTTYTLSIDKAVSQGYFDVREFDSAGSTLGTSHIPSVGGTTFTTDANMAYVYMRFLGIEGEGTEYSGTYRIMLELGSTATDYEPPNITTTPIDLQGHTLNSLPDGTRDELTIDATGAVTLTKRTQTVQLDGDAPWSRNETPFVHYTSSWSAYGGSPSGYSSDRHFVDKLPASSKVANGLYSANTNGNTAYLREPAFASDAAGVKEWMGTNTPTVIMPLATPQTIPLTSVTLPTLPAPTVNVYADAESSVTGYAMGPDAGMEYERDVTIAFDKLQAQVSATTVREATNG